jgi:hypothetical protein
MVIEYDRQLEPQYETWFESVLVRRSTTSDTQGATANDSPRRETDKIRSSQSLRHHWKRINNGTSGVSGLVWHSRARVSNEDYIWDQNTEDQRIKSDMRCTKRDSFNQDPRANFEDTIYESDKTRNSWDQNFTIRDMSHFLVWDLCVFSYLW